MQIYNSVGYDLLDSKINPDSLVNRRALEDLPKVRPL